MNDPEPADQSRSPGLRQQMRHDIAELASRNVQPSAPEMLQRLEEEYGWHVRREFALALAEVGDDGTLTRAIRDYARSLVNSGDVARALHGGEATDSETVTGIDTLIRASKAHRSSLAFAEMVTFMARFRDYAPYNNMLVKIQNPSCGFYAREKDWRERFNRHLKEDARPMLILAPKHPVLLVYDLDQTEGDPLPEDLAKFSVFEGEYDPVWLKRVIDNALSYRIRVDVKELSSTHAGRARSARNPGDIKMQITLHAGLDGPSQLGVLAHELAHILLGHLGSDSDWWWPSRTNIATPAQEIEAEAAAYIVSSRLGLKGTSASYVSCYLTGAELPEAVSIDMIAKVAGTIERMARATVPAKKPRSETSRSRVHDDRLFSSDPAGADGPEGDR